jgi:uncharacterized membrane protein
VAAKPEETERGIERLIFFTDAVAAIAITLLILPLVEEVTSAAKVPHASVASFVADNVSQIFAFVLSFLIIARLWLANHRVLENTVRTTSVLMWLDIAWAFTIVVLPLPTEITAVFHQSVQTVTLYIGSAFASTLLLTAMSLYLYLHPELERKGTSLSAVQLYGMTTTTVGFILALVLELIFPALNYWTLFALFIAVPLDLVIKPKIVRAEAAKTARADAGAKPSSPAQP